MTQPESLHHILTKQGIVKFDNVFSPEELSAIKASIDPIFEAKKNQARSYVHPDELVNAGLWQTIFSEKMLSVLFSIMPDPVLYHCHVYEIAGNSTTPHIFGNILTGWHRDPDSEYNPNYPTHISLFIYLTDVGEGDGAFEFIPFRLRWLKRSTPYISVLGQSGFTFAWNRPFYHRASPNYGRTRRRLLKLSIQRNEFISTHLSNKHFQSVLKLIPPGDAKMDLLLGRYQGKTAPSFALPDALPLEKLKPNKVLEISNKQLSWGQIKKALITLIKLIIKRKPAKVSYYD